MLWYIEILILLRYLWIIYFYYLNELLREMSWFWNCYIILIYLKLCNDFGINLFFLMIYLDDEDKLFIDVLIGLIFLYVIIIFLFLGGNILVVLVFVKGWCLRIDFRFFLINFVVFDLIMVVFCMFFIFVDSIMGYWVFIVFLCLIVLFF